MKNNVIFLTRKIILFFIVMVLISLLIIFRDYLIGKLSYIFIDTDTISAYFPYRIFSLSLSIHNIGDFIYQIGPGTNFFSMKAFFLDPFKYIYCLFPQSIGWFYVPVIKWTILSLVVTITINCRNNSYVQSFVWALFFSLCGFSIYWSQTDSNYTQMILVCIQWLGYELYRKNNKLSYFIILSLPLFMFSYIYWGIIFNIFLVVFILLDTVWDTDSFINKVRFLGKLVLGYCVVLAISAWSILPELFVLAHNGRVGGVSKAELIQMLMHVNIYCQFILRGFGNYVIPFDKIWASAFSGPLWYSSIFINISCIAFLLSPSNKKLIINIIIVLILLVLMPVVSLFLNGFSQGTMRWTWFLLLPIFICAVKFWQSKPNFNKFRLAIIILGLIFFLSASYSYHIGDLYFSDKNILYTYVEIAIVFGLLFLVSYLRRYTFILLACIGLFDTLFNGYMFIHNAQPIDADYRIKHQYYYDNTINAVNKIKSEDNSVFYRMDKTYSSLNLCPFCGLNENLIQGYNGVKQYISTPNPAYFKFSADMDAKPYYNFIFGFDGRSDVLRMLGVKYLLSKSESDISGYSYQQKVDDIYIYQVNNYYGIGHIFHDYITRDDFMQLSTTDKDLAFSRCTILDNKQLSTVGVRQISSQDCLGHESVLNNNVESFNLAVLNGRHVVGSANLVKTGILYLAIPYDQGFSALVDGKSVSVLNVSDGFVGIELTSGSHSIELDYFPPLLKIGLLISIITLVFFVFYIIIIYKRKLNEKVFRV